MSKKFKKKIEDLCGLVGLSWEARQERARQILCNNNWKQQLCNDFQGLSFRDLELHLQGVVTERQKKEEGVERKQRVTRDNNEKPMQRDSTKSTSSPKVRPRTLSEILEQVHGPRRESAGFSDEEREQLKLFAKKAGLNVPPNALDDNHQTGE